MILTLTTDDGKELGRWEIEVDFGDICKPFPKSTMTDDIVSAFKRQKAKEDAKNGNT